MRKKLWVRTSRERIEEQSPKLIKRSLIREAGLPANLAGRIAEEVSSELRRMNLKFVSGPLIRELICIKLLEYGLEDARKRYTRVGMPVYDVSNLIFEWNKENANIFYNPSFVHKAMGDEVAKQYALLRVIPIEASDAHMNGDIHIHDLDYFLTRPFCFMHSMQFFLRRGLCTDGLGVYTAVARPAKHLDSAIMQLAKVLQVSQLFFSGGQGFDDFNIYLAPYVRGLSYREVKQAVQYFIYDLDMSNFSRGGQTAFTSVGLEFQVPSYLQDVRAVLPGGKIGKECYENFEEEGRLIMRAFIENYLGGDGKGKPFHFPKPEFKLRRGVWKKNDDLLLQVHKLVSKFGSPYFLNFIPAYMPNVIQSQCCRYFMIPESEQLKELKEGKLRFGSLQVVTINLPRCAYLARGSDERLFEEIRRKIMLSKLVFDAKRDFLRRYILNGGSPFLLMDFDGEPYFKIDEQTCNVGFVGLNEMLKFHLGEELHESKEAWKFGLRVVRFMTREVKKLDSGHRYALVQTPAESCAHRLALIDLRQFGRKALVKGERRRKVVYYTNSSHLYVGARIPLWRRIKIESSFHPLVQGGAIMHVWLGEAEPDSGALMKLTQKISTRSLCSYFAFTKDLTICMRCNKVYGGLLKRCKQCRASEDELEWYSRVTGYITRVKAWNPGKKAELKERFRYRV
jgi:ribonucleoside-triphosphate reductase